MLLKLATWNLAVPVALHRREAMRACIDQIDADVWVFTESHDGFAPNHFFSHSSLAGRDGNYKAPHRWVTIWSKHPLEPVTTTDQKRTAAVRIHPKSSSAFIVFGTVLPWKGSPWREYPSAGGVAFREALSVQAGDWRRLQKEYPDDELFILGDCNQELVTPRSSGTLTNQRTLERVLSNQGLIALTGGDEDPIRRDSAPLAAIDHICCLRNSEWTLVHTERWPDVPVPEKGLSDHFGVSALLQRD